VRRGRAAQIAGRRIGDRSTLAVSAASRTSREVVAGVKLDVRLEHAQRVSGRGGLLVLQGVLLNRAIVLAEVIDARIGL